jgi:signal transduction histidine kinase
VKIPFRPRSLFWPIAGMALVTLVLGTVTQLWVVDRVILPLETRESKARAEVVAATLASELAIHPRPAAAVLDTMLARQRVNLGPRPGTIVYQSPNAVLVTAPRGREQMISKFLAGDPAPDRGDGTGRRDKIEVLARHDIQGGGSIMVSRPMRPRDPFGRGGSRAALLFLPVATIASLGAGLILVRLLARRLRGIEMLAARVAEGDLSVRIHDRTGDEIGRIAERLDDMTARLGENRAQIAANEEQRRQLFADITHELATPLTSIRGSAETLLDPRVHLSEEDRTKYVRGVLEEAGRLDRLIRDVFELARLEAGASPLALERLDWAALCRNTIERFKPQFEKGGLELSWRSPLAVAWIEADGLRIEQVLDNLLVNALRYVPRGGTVELALTETSPGRYRATLSDNGPGLPAEELASVFERFYRGSVAKSAGDLREGSGLGLAIVREIVERHGGAVRAEARKPHGLVFVIELPAAAAPERQSTA